MYSTYFSDSSNMDLTIQLPKALRAKVMLWADVTFQDMEEIDNAESVSDLERVLCALLKVDLPEPRRGVLLELYVHTVLFSRQWNFNKEQTSTLLSIIKSLHEANIDTPLNNIQLCFNYSKELILCHSVRRPPFSINLFSFKEAKGIMDYIYNSYIRHFKLYKHLFTSLVIIDMSLTYNEPTAVKNTGRSRQNLAAVESGSGKN